MTLTVPHRVRVRPFRAYELPAGVIYVGRGVLGYPASPYANPYVVGRAYIVAGVTVVVRDRLHAVALYRAHLHLSPVLQHAAARDLVGHDLACWCPLDEPCHADLLLAIATGGRA